MPPQLIELLVIYGFTERGASPHGVPATHVQGFARFLQLLFQYDWEGFPLVVDVDEAGNTIDSAAVESAWSSREQNAAAMFVVTNYDLKSVWTQGHPSVGLLAAAQGLRPRRHWLAVQPQRVGWVVSPSSLVPRSNVTRFNHLTSRRHNIRAERLAMR